MAICPNCRSSEIEYDSAAGNSICISCGTVVEESAVVAEVTFAELSNGASVLEGQFISAELGKTNLPTIFGRRVGNIGGKTGDNGPSESREMTLSNGRRRIQALAGAVGLNGDHYVDAAHRWYALALQHQFTRGRRGPNVTAACLYIVCRQEKTPHMLLDFADILSTSVYSLGGTFLRLVRLLNLEMPIIDPSFFVARFAARLEFGEKTSKVSNTALRVVARMKRDWIQTGRRPAGVCAAGLIIAARMHGFRRTETEVVRVVRICEATLKKRLEEFGKTPSSQLTPQEFEGIWLEQEADPPSFAHTRPKPAEPGTVHILPTLFYQQQQQQSQRDAISPALNFVETFPLTPASSQATEEGEEESLSLSDVEIDEEIENMLLSETEITLKTRYWTEMNKDYLEKEAIKEKIIQEEEAEAEERERERELEESTTTKTTVNKRKTEKDGYEANVKGLEPFSLKKQPLSPSSYSSSKATVNKKKRVRTVKSTNSKDNVVAESAAEATKQILQNKRFSKRINYQALDELFQSTAAAIR